jgi:hypothetical protein
MEHELVVLEAALTCPLLVRRDGLTVPEEQVQYVDFFSLVLQRTDIFPITKKDKRTN